MTNIKPKNQTASLRKKAFSSLKSPYAVLIGAALGVGIGLASKDISLLLAPAGEMYLTILQLCVFPILISAITVSIFKLLATDDFSKYLSKILVVFGLGFFISVATGVLVTLVFTPGKIQNTTEVGLGELMLQDGPYEEIYLNAPATVESSQSMASFFLHLIPKNIFAALVEGNSLQVLIFSILLGLSLGVIGAQKGKAAVDFFDAIFEAFIKVIMGLMYLLPFALCSLLAKTISTSGSHFLFAVAGLLAVIVGTFLAAIVLILVAINFKASHLTTLQTLKALKEPILVAVSTANTLATMPSVLHALTEKMHYDKEKVALVVPISGILGRFGYMAIFSIIAVYLAQVYDIELTFVQLVFIMISSILAGVATAGAPSGVAIASIAIVLSPLNLPVETAITILLLINPITSSILTLVHVSAGMLIATFIAKRIDDKQYM